MYLFDAIPRVDGRPKRRREPSFTFLNRSARPEFDPIRGLIESWFERLPLGAREDVRGRFRSESDRAHSGALFELFVHELLVRLGCAIEVHPELSTGQKRPDFLAHLDGGRFYLEATDVYPMTSSFTPDALEDAVLDAIDDLNSPNFFVSVNTQGKLSTAPSHRRVVQPFAELMAAHDPDEVERRINALGYDAVPALEVTHENWSLRGSLMPKSAAKRGDGKTRTIGFGPPKGGWVDSSTPVRKAVAEKARKYGELDAPYVVAINAHGLDDRIDEMEALFGKERFTFRGDRLDDPPEFSREPDGVWVGWGHRPQYARLQAVLIFRGIAPWSLHGGYACMYLNPHATLELPKPCCACRTPERTRARCSGSMVKTSGTF